MAVSNPTGKGGFQKGQSGNPGGRPKGWQEVRELSRHHTREALETLIKLMRSSQSEKVQLAAANAILDRGWGKPIQALSVEDEDGNPMVPTVQIVIPDNGRDGYCGGGRGQPEVRR